MGTTAPTTVLVRVAVATGLLVVVAVAGKGKEGFLEPMETAAPMAWVLLHDEISGQVWLNEVS
jgi:hypothetical protein